MFCENYLHFFHTHHRILGIRHPCKGFHQQHNTAHDNNPCQHHTPFEAFGGFFYSCILLAYLISYWLVFDLLGFLKSPFLDFLCQDSHTHIHRPRLVFDLLWFLTLPSQDFLCQDSQQSSSHLQHHNPWFVFDLLRFLTLMSQDVLYFI